MTTSDFGALDGEAVQLVTAKLTGGDVVDRRYDEGERVVLVIDAQVGVPRFRRAGGNHPRAGALIREHTFKVERIAEATDTIAADAAEFLREIGIQRGDDQDPLFDPDDTDQEDEQ